MKNFLINSTSNLFNAGLVAGAILLFASSPAQAWGDREQGILTGVIGTLIFQEITRPQEPVVINRTHTRAMPDHNPLNDRRRGSYTRGYDNPSLVCGQQVNRTSRYVEVIHTNCYGEILFVERTPRYAY
jgi:hypothetical protein